MQSWARAYVAGTPGLGDDADAVGPVKARWAARLSAAQLRGNAATLRGNAGLRRADFAPASRDDVAEAGCVGLWHICCLRAPLRTSSS